MLKAGAIDELAPTNEDTAIVAASALTRSHDMNREERIAITSLPKADAHERLLAGHFLLEEYG
jgi:hypothetical protein